MRLFTVFSVAILGFTVLACAGVGQKTGTDTAGVDEPDDDDDDGYDEDVDCDDDNAVIHPDAQEICDPNDVDEDCDGVSDSFDDSTAGMVQVYRDADEDGHGGSAGAMFLCEVEEGFVASGDDCDDADPTVSPSALEVCDPLDVDEDCDGLSDDSDPSVDTSSFLDYYADLDGDGWGDPTDAARGCDAGAGRALFPDDCDDDDARVNPDAAEVWYDGFDSDCSGGSDYDRDGDGYDAEGYGTSRDCNDRSSAAYPGATETWYDGVDADCSGGSDYDRDGDGQDSDAYGGLDCDDTRSNVYYGAPESGSSGDTNCDGAVRATPVAVASYTSTDTLYTCTTVHLDGTGSSNPSGGVLTYDWELISAPASSATTSDDIVDVDDASPNFAPDESGDYTFGLTVTNSSGVVSVQDLLDITVTDRSSNQAPTSNAGSDQTLTQSATCSGGTGYGSDGGVCDDCSDQEFTLSATASSDPDGDALTYTWSITTGTGTLTESNGASTVLTIRGGTTTDGATTSTAVTVLLTATDCYGRSSTDTVTLTSSCTGS